jgi:hypothetical protein
MVSVEGRQDDMMSRRWDYTDRWLRPLWELRWIIFGDKNE